MYFKLNQPAAALPLILQAIELEKDADATLYDHLGDIYAAMGEVAKAREAWTKSVATDDKPEVRKKLESAPSK